MRRAMYRQQESLIKQDQIYVYSMLDPPIFLLILVGRIKRLIPVFVRREN